MTLRRGSRGPKLVATRRPYSSLPVPPTDATYPQGVTPVRRPDATFSGTSGGDFSADFAAALTSLSGFTTRPEIDIDEAPAPQRLARFALALTADVGGEDELGSGRLVVLHDPDGQPTWQGTFRIVTFIRAHVESELAADPMLAEVGWAWLIESLQRNQAEYGHIAGTVTRTASTPFGSMTDQPAKGELEVRASWTAMHHNLAPHVRAWTELLATAAGLEPLAPGVVALPRRTR